MIPLPQSPAEKNESITQTYAGMHSRQLKVAIHNALCVFAPWFCGRDRLHRAVSLGERGFARRR